MDGTFWDHLDRLVASSRIVIDRPRGTIDSDDPARVYPADYGYLAGTTAPDGEGIDVWIGAGGVGDVQAIICTVDLLKRDSEIKVLLGCTPAEQAAILAFMNAYAPMRGLLIQRGEGV